MPSLKPNPTIATWLRQPTTRQIPPNLSRTTNLPLRTTPPSQRRAYNTPSTRNLPKIASPSLWSSLVPKFLRNRSRSPKSAKSKEWNPASFYIIIFTLIGSQAIRMIALKNDYAAYTRSTDAKITLLREVIQRVKDGEEVDVERLLGTGDEAKEREWEDVLREIEDEDSLWHKKGADEPESNSQKQQAAMQSTEEVAAKETAIPAEEPGTNMEPSNESRSKRKLNFY